MKSTLFAILLLVGSAYIVSATPNQSCTLFNQLEAEIHHYKNLRYEAQSDAQRQNMDRMIQHLSGRALPALEACWDDIRKDASVGVQLQIWYKLGLLNWDSGNTQQAYVYFRDCYFHEQANNSTLGSKTIAQLSENYLLKYGDGYDERLHQESHLSQIATSIEKEEILLAQAQQRSPSATAPQNQQSIKVYEREGNLVLPARTQPIVEQLPTPNNPMADRSKSRPGRVQQTQDYERVIVLDPQEQAQLPVTTTPKATTYYQDRSTPDIRRTKKSAFGIKRYVPKQYQTETQNPQPTQSYAPLTPASYNPSTPTSYNPSTPVSYNPSTPVSYNPSTPVSYNPSTPVSYNPSTPVSYNPSTPTSYTPPTPASASPASDVHVVTFYYNSGTTNNQYQTTTKRKRGKGFKITRQIRR